MSDISLLSCSDSSSPTFKQCQARILMCVVWALTHTMPLGKEQLRTPSDLSQSVCRSQRGQNAGPRSTHWERNPHVADRTSQVLTELATSEGRELRSTSAASFANPCLWFSLALLSTAEALRLKSSLEAATFTFIGRESPLATSSQLPLPVQTPEPSDGWSIDIQNGSKEDPRIRSRREER